MNSGIKLYTPLEIHFHDYRRMRTGCARARARRTGARGAGGSRTRTRRAVRPEAHTRRSPCTRCWWESGGQMRAGDVVVLLQFSFVTQPSLVFSNSRGAARGAHEADLDVSACFNATDSTECLQRGFDAAGEFGQLVVVPAMPSPWIVRPLYLRRNGSHIRLAPGAIIEARHAL